MKCKVCGNEIIGRRRQAKYCSEECARIAKNAMTLESIRNRTDRDVFDRNRKCECCGADYIAKRRNQKYCSKECTKQAQQLRYHEKKPAPATKKNLKPKVCTVCGKTFTPNNVRQLTCSIECAKLRQQENCRKWDRIRSERKPKKNNDPTVEKLCPKDCFYRSEITSLISCDYILLTGTPRPCGIGKECTVYTNVGKAKKSRPVMTFKSSEDLEYESYKVESMNREIGREHRRGNVVSRRGKVRR